MHTVPPPAPPVHPESVDAWLLGHALGVHSEIGEPPAGFGPEQAAAYRAGFAAAQAAGATFDDCPVDRGEYRSADHWPDWTDQVRAGVPSEEDVAAFASERYRDDNDQQPDPFAIEAWAMTEFDFYTAENDLWESREEDRRVTEEVRSGRRRAIHPAEVDRVFGMRAFEVTGGGR